jgi:Zn-dependent protease with chaperone function
VPFWLIRRRPKSWWLWGAGAVAPILILGAVIFPVWVLPQFTTFTPLPPSPLRTAIEAEAARVSLTKPTILLMDRSSDSKTFDAYVAGLGGTARIVIFDTTLTTLTEPEILFLIGHEMKHYLMHDLWKLTGIYIGLAFIGFFATDRLARLATRRWGHRLGFSNIGEPAALPLLWVSLEIVILIVTPLVNAATRHMEHEADRFGLEMTHDNRAAASMFIKHQSEALGVPYPGWLERTFRQNHPSLGDRIMFANDYHPWEDGKPLVYGDRIKPAE